MVPETLPLPCVSAAFVTKTLPLPSSSTTFVAKTLPMPCVSAAFVTKTSPLPSSSTAFVAKTLPLPCASTASEAWFFVFSHFFRLRSVRVSRCFSGGGSCATVPMGGVVMRGGVRDDAPNWSGGYRRATPAVPARGGLRNGVGNPVKQTRDLL